MPRFHLFELEDQPWLPSAVRDLATDYLHFMEQRFALHRPVVELLRDALLATGSTEVIDLCSGGAGPTPAIHRELAQAGLAVRFVLTDRFPNLPAFQRIAGESHGAIRFIAQPVDARVVPADLVGFRTISNAFHHFRPADALAVLRDAVRANQPIGIFEIPERSARAFLPLLLTPVFVFIATPFIRPFQLRRFVLTYLLPLVPLVCWWDGLVSQLRAYTVPEFEALASEDSPSDYQWNAGRVPIGTTPGFLTYLIGYPRRADH